MDSVLVHNGNEIVKKGSYKGDSLRGNNNTNSAQSISQDGNGQAIAGHGTYGFSTGTITTVPNGTTVIALTHNKKLSDVAGRFLESTNNLEKLARLQPTQRLPMFNKWVRKNGKKPKGMTDVKYRIILKKAREDIQDLKIYKENQEIPNYLITYPKKIHIYNNSQRVTNPTQLDKLLKPNQGCVGLATCTEINYNK